MIRAAHRGAAAAGAVIGVVVLAGLGMAGPAAGGTDPTEGGLWYYTVPGFEQIHASGVTGEGITVAIIDGPINPASPDLVGTNLVVTEPSFCDEDGDGVPEPATSTTKDAEHATSLASFIVGTGAGVGGQPGVRGVAPGATVLHYTRDYLTSEDSCYLDGVNGIALAMDQAVSDGADIISMSFSGAGWHREGMNALVRALRAGVVLVAASNNQGGDFLGFPAEGNGVIGVDYADVHQNLGPGSVHNPRLSVIAPGIDIRVLAANDGAWDTYKIISGSSVSTAWTAGVLALAWSAHPEATGNQMIQALLRTTAQSTGDLTRIDDYWGYGTVSVRNLLAADPTTMPDVNPLIVDEYSVVPGLERILAPEPTPEPEATGPTPAKPDPRPAGTAGLLPGIAIGALAAVLLGATTATILTRRRARTSRGD